MVWVAFFADSKWSLTFLFLDPDSIHSPPSKDHMCFPCLKHLTNMRMTSSVSCCFGCYSGNSAKRTGVHAQKVLGQVIACKHEGAALRVLATGFLHIRIMCPKGAAGLVSKAESETGPAKGQAIGGGVCFWHTVQLSLKGKVKGGPTHFLWCLNFDTPTLMLLIPPPSSPLSRRQKQELQSQVRMMMRLLGKGEEEGCQRGNQIWQLCVFVSSMWFWGFAWIGWYRLLHLDQVYGARLSHVQLSLRANGICRCWHL